MRKHFLALSNLRTLLVKNQRFGITMSLVTCSKIVRPCLTLFRPTAASSRLNRSGLFSSLQKRSKFVASRLLSRHYPRGINRHRKNDSERKCRRENRYVHPLGWIAFLLVLLFLAVSRRNILFVFCLALCLYPFVPVNDHFQTRN